MWLDVRIEKRDLPVAAQALASMTEPAEIRIDPNPPAAGPEVEISVRSVRPDTVLHVLERELVPVLAHRLRGWER